MCTSFCICDNALESNNRYYVFSLPQHGSRTLNILVATIMNQAAILCTAGVYQYCTYRLHCSHHGDPGSILGQPKWDLWWIKWYTGFSQRNRERRGIKTLKKNTTYKNHNVRTSFLCVTTNNFWINSLTRIYLTDLTIQNEKFKDGPDGQPFTKQEILKEHL